MFFQRFHTECAQFEGPLADSAVEVVQELAKCAAINSDRAVGKIPLTFLDTSDRRTHGDDCESHQHISSKQKKMPMTEAVNERTYLRPD